MAKTVKLIKLTLCKTFLLSNNYMLFRTRSTGFFIGKLYWDADMRLGNRDGT